MRKILSLFILMTFSVFPFSAFAILSLELTQGVAGAIPIAVVPFALKGQQPPQDIATIISNDLQNSGRFKVFGAKKLSQFPSKLKEVSVDYFRRLGTNNIVIGSIQVLDDGRYEVNFQLLDIFSTKANAALITSNKYTVNERDLRAVAHHISDIVYKQITGVRGVFSTKLAYVVIDRSQGLGTRYVLEVCDQDGFNPRPLLNSSEPIMSPAWSPSGKELAYVSFENKEAAIYIQTVTTGERRVISHFPGINGAPSWSPDGSKLALVLSKSGSPNIYVMDIASGNLKQVTKDFYINTEPSFSPDGKSLLFTSNRSGGPQIYQVNLKSGQTSRVSYDGDYNARAVYTADGNGIAMIHRVNGLFKIGILDLNNGRMQVLTPLSADSSSPSVAPNGSMILYDTYVNNHNVLGMVSADAKVQLVLPARSGDAQDAAWSPYIS